ncbi:MAG: radical SAM protein [Candidatus Altiarchaeia archaeon]
MEKNASEIEKTPYHSYKLKTLPKGCKYCVKGQKLVLFITGVCNRKCFYCPISDEKKNKDVIYANEWNTEHAGGDITGKELDIIIQEATLCNAKGAGITGGDPLLVTERTVAAINRLKSVFGRKFHIHLYTSLENVTEQRLQDLFNAGLDEIRFHPNLEDESVWDRIKLAKLFRWDVGVEIPVIPGYEDKTKKLVDYVAEYINFLNLNELELSDSSGNILEDKGYKAKDEESYAVSGSEDMGLALMRYCEEKGYKFKIHFCTVKLKDAVQIAERIKKRSKNAASTLDLVTDEGLLIRGVIYLKETAPSFSYRKMLKEMDPAKRKELIEKLNALQAELVKKYSLKKDAIIVDDYKLRLLTSYKKAKKLAARLKAEGLVPAIVEEYPTKDALEMDIEFL